MFSHTSNFSPVKTAGVTRISRKLSANLWKRPSAKIFFGKYFTIYLLIFFNIFFLCAFFLLNFSFPKISFQRKLPPPSTQSRHTRRLCFGASDGLKSEKGKHKRWEGSVFGCYEWGCWDIDFPPWKGCESKYLCGMMTWKEERENAKKRREEEEGGEMREREFGTFSLHILNVNILFRTL